jgi:5'-3' exonuclease
VARPLLVALDGDGLVHRAFHGMGRGGGDLDVDREGRPVWALRGLVTAVAATVARLRPHAVLVAFDDAHQDCVRRAAHPHYKAQRPPRERALHDQLTAAPPLLRQAGIPSAQAPGWEGDDVLASAARLARQQDWDCVLVTSDRDSFALLDATTSVLRVREGGVDGAALLTPHLLASTYGVRPDQYRDYAVLRGDTSDNLPGAPGVGPTLASRLLAEFGSLATLLETLDGGGATAVAAVTGPAVAERLTDPAVRADLLRTVEIMTMRSDLPLPDPEQLRLPLDRPRLIAALRARQIMLGPSLWALVGGEPPSWSPSGFDTVPAQLPSPAAAPTWRARTVPAMVDLIAAHAQQPVPAGRGDSTVAVARRRGGRMVEVAEDQLELF